MNRILTSAAGLILVYLIGYLLYVGRSLLIPLVIAIFIWHLLNTINNSMQRLFFYRKGLPQWVSMFLSFIVVALFLKILIDIISDNVTDVMGASQRYQENLLTIFNAVDARFHVKTLVSMDSVLKNFSMQSMLVNVYGVFSTIAGSAVLITLYVIFLFVEQHFFKHKMDVLFPQKGHRNLVNNILNHIVNDTQTYLGLKTLLSLVTAFSSWVIMKAVGLDFAEFWALLIFFLNFIPNIGAIIATAFPVVLAIIQFKSWLPFILISSGIVAVQFIVGNIIEPRFLGRSLNLSAIVILIALALWGAIWGILGMFLSVPITVMMMIIFAHFETTRPIAILLSQNGDINNSYKSLGKEE